MQKFIGNINETGSGKEGTGWKIKCRYFSVYCQSLYIEFLFQLSNCICDGSETYDCENIRHNMNRYNIWYVLNHHYSLSIHLTYLRLCLKNVRAPEDSTISVSPSTSTSLDTVAEEGSIGTTEATPRTLEPVSPYLVISIVTTYTNAYIGQAVITYLQDVILK